MSSTKRGVFVAIEGPDGVGKTTQVARFEKDGATVFRNPDRTTHVGQLLNRYLSKEIELSKEVVHLLFLANAHEVAEKIEAALKRGEMVVVDRYVDTAVVYGMVRGSDPAKIAADYSGLPRPHLVFVLELDPVKAAERASKRGLPVERYDAIETQRALYEGFKGRGFPVDASQSEDEIYTFLKSAIEVHTTMSDAIEVGRAVEEI